MGWSRGDEVSTWAAQVAEAHGLHCYDPQRGRLRTPQGDAWRFELTSARGASLHDPTSRAGSCGARTRSDLAAEGGSAARHRHRQVDDRPRSPTIAVTVLSRLDVAGCGATV
jgi:hypothetical protein